MMSVASPREFSANYSTITRRQHPPLPPPRDVPKVVAPSTTEQHYASSSIKSHYLSRTNQTGPKLLPSSPPPLPLPLHYQETEFSRTPSTPRPGSALGQLLSRFGTLRRKARGHFTGRSASSRRSETPSHSQIYAPASIAGFPMGASNTINTAARDTASPFRPRSSSRPGSLAAGTARIPQLPPSQPLVLDPEIYASGKRQVAPEEIYAEGARALDSNAERRLLEHELDPALMVEGETRTIIEEQSRRRADYRLLVRQLLGWLNDELAEQRIIVRDLQEDLYDGQVLCKLIEKLQRVKLDMVEVTQNELAQKYKLRLVLEQVNKNLASQARTWAPRISWSVEGIHNKNMIEILQLLIAMALYYRAPLRMPANVVVQVLVFQKRHDELVRQSHQVQLTDEHVSSLPDQLRAPATTPATIATVSDASGARRRDAFDTLIECAPEKLHIVKRSLARFCNRHLNKINMSCGPGDDLRPENFSDGLLLVFLIASLEDYFVPLGSLFTTTAPRLTTTNAATKHHNSFVEDSPTELPFIDANNNNVTDLDDLYVIGIEQPTALEPSSYTCSQPIEKLHNVNVALQLIQEAGLTDIRERVRAEEIVNSDLKAVLRALYAIFGRYKHL